MNKKEIGSIARIEQKLDDLADSNTEAHNAILSRLDKLNGTVQEHGRKLAVLDERAEQQTWVNRAIYGAIFVAIIITVIASYLRL